MREGGNATKGGRNGDEELLFRMDHEEAENVALAPSHPTWSSGMEGEEPLSRPPSSVVRNSNDLSGSDSGDGGEYSDFSGSEDSDELDEDVAQIMRWKKGKSVEVGGPTYVPPQPLPTREVDDLSPPNSPGHIDDTELHNLVIVAAHDPSSPSWPAGLSEATPSPLMGTRRTHPPPGLTSGRGDTTAPPPLPTGRPISLSNATSTLRGPSFAQSAAAGAGHGAMSQARQSASTHASQKKSDVAFLAAEISAGLDFARERGVMMEEIPVMGARSAFSKSGKVMTAALAAAATAPIDIWDGNATPSLAASSTLHFTPPVDAVGIVDLGPGSLPSEDLPGAWGERATASMTVEASRPKVSVGAGGHYEAQAAALSSSLPSATTSRNSSPVKAKDFPVAPHTTSEASPVVEESPVPASAPAPAHAHAPEKYRPPGARKVGGVKSVKGYQSIFSVFTPVKKSRPEKQVAPRLGFRMAGSTPFLSVRDPGLIPYPVEEQDPNDQEGWVATTRSRSRSKAASTNTPKKPTMGGRGISGASPGGRSPSVAARSIGKSPMLRSSTSASAVLRSRSQSISGRPQQQQIPGGSSDPKDKFFTKSYTDGEGNAKYRNFVEHRYLKFREKALAQRKKAGPGDSREMYTLFRFWSHFLRTKFNKSMYDEFKTLAIGDYKAGSDYGLQCLYRFYSYGLEAKYREFLYADFVKTCLAQLKHRDTDTYGLEKLVAFFTYRTAQTPLPIPEVLRPHLETHNSLASFNPTAVEEFPRINPANGCRVE